MLSPVLWNVIVFIIVLIYLLNFTINNINSKNTKWITKIENEMKVMNEVIIKNRNSVSL